MTDEGKVHVSAALAPRPGAREVAPPAVALDGEAAVAWAESADSRQSVRLQRTLTHAVRALSLGELPHDAANCDLGGRPHLGPCQTPGGQIVQVHPPDLLFR